jgi:hypothetical protein
MDIFEGFSYFAGVASIIGAILSIWQARKSKRSADRAQEIKEQIISNKETSELTELRDCLQQAKRSMEKFGPGAIPSNLAGISPLIREVQDVQGFYEILKLYRCLFGQTTPNKADIFSEDLRIALESYAQSENNQEILENGKNVYILLIGFSSEVKLLLDEKLETTF